MTLIELLAALTIASLLAIAVLGVVANLSRAQTRATAARQSLSRQEALRRLLTLDVRHAQSYRETDEGFELVSRAALDPEDLNVRHLAGTVSYEVVATETDTWLVRRQQSQLGGDLAELVCPDVLGIAIEAVPEEDNGVIASGSRDLPDTTAGAQREGAENWQPLPRRLRIVCVSGGSDAADLTFEMNRGW